MKTKLLVFSVLLLSATAMAQNNLIDTSTWVEGTGSVVGFSRNGTDAENVRELGVNPHGNTEVLWKAVPDAANNADGGWNGYYFTIDPTKTYRFSVWIKKTNSNNGRTYFGLRSVNPSSQHTTLQLDGTERANAYFWSGDLPQLDKWYLLIGHMHGSAYTGGNNDASGIYDGATGTKVLNATDYKFRADAERLRHRAYLYYDIETADRQFFWGPTVYEVNGQEPSIAELITPNTNTGGGDSLWTAAGSDINYTAGKVGIGTTLPDEALTVKGKIHTEEVRVDLSVPAPDYVFYDTYDLISLDEVRQHINEHGHLPKIPSGKIMESEGVELGIMNMKLLEKIEELTLYILEQEERITKLESWIKAQEK